MLFTAVAIAVGLAAGRLLGGRARHLGDRPFRAWPALALGVLLQAGTTLVGRGPALALVVVSYAALVCFALRNVHLVGMWLVALGLALNGLVIAVNGGMPVRPAAAVAAGVAPPAGVGDLVLGGKRHLERPSDRLVLLADVIPVPVLHEVVSFGDLVLGVGVADVVAHLLTPRRRRLAV